MKRLFCSVVILLAVFLIFGCGGGGGDSNGPSDPPNVSEFTAADLAGDYYLCGISTGGASEGWRMGFLSIDLSGVPSGVWAESEDTYDDVTNGSISLDGNGILKGTFSTDLFTSTINYGKLNVSKKFFSISSATNTGEFDLITGVKTASAYSLSEFAGDWAITGWFQGPAGKIVFTDTFSVDAGGIIDSANDVWDGTITLVNEYPGLFKGNIAGVMDFSKEFIVFFSNHTGGQGFSIGIKKGGTFSPSDLKGKWHLNFASKGDIQGVCQYGVVELDSSGKVLNGHYYYPSGTDVQILVGNLNLDGDGNISGNVFTSDGMEFEMCGKMNASKNLMSLAALGRDSTSFIIANK